MYGNVTSCRVFLYVVGFVATVSATTSIEKVIFMDHCNTFWKSSDLCIEVYTG